MILIDREALCQDLLDRWSVADEKEEEEIQNVMADVVTPIVFSQPTIEMPSWIPCSERLPECEQEVLICTEKKLVGKDAYIDSIVTPAIYEDGTMLEVDSIWDWDEYIYDEWDDTEDCGIIPEGWFENRHFNPEGVFNNPIDRKVVAWMPLPEPYREDGEA